METNSNTNTNKKIWLIAAALIVLGLLMSNIDNQTTSNRLGTTHDACNYLNDHGIKTKKSKNPKVSRSICMSDYVNIYESGLKNTLPNNIAYYVMGEGSRIDKLKVVANFNHSPSEKTNSKALSAFNTVLKKSLNITELSGLTEAVEELRSAQWKVKGTGGNLISNVYLYYDKWPNEGYEFRLIID